MNMWGQSKTERGQTDDVGSGHGMAKVKRQQSRQNRAAAGEHSRWTIRPAQALKNSCRRPGRYRPRSKTTASRRRWPASRRAVQVGGGSAVVLATRKVGSDLPYLSPSHLSPLPVSVNTHSLNLKKTQFSPNLFLLFLFLFLLPHYKSSPNPLYCLCSANLSRHLAYSQPLRSLPGGE